MNLKIAHLNIRSLPAHFLEIRKLLTQHNIDILTLSETWLSDNIDSRILKIPLYNFYRCDRRGRGGGGVAVYCKDNINPKIDKCTADDVNEIMWLTFAVSNGTIALGVVYRPPNTNFSVFLNTFADLLADHLIRSNRLICTGDFNVNLLDLSDSKTQRLLNLISSMNLTQIIKQPTRITTSSATLLDLIIVNEDYPPPVSNVFKVSYSDHYGVCSELNFKSNKNMRRSFQARNFTHFNYEEFVSDLYKVPWFLIYDLPNVDLKLAFLNSNILRTLEKHAPIKQYVFTRPPAPWITYNVKLMMKARDVAHRRYHKTRNPVHYEFYKSLRNEVNRAIKREKAAYFSYRCSVNATNKQKLWKEIKNLNLCHQNNNHDIPGNLADVDAINKYFLSPVAFPLKDIPTINFHHSCTAPKFQFKAITSDEILGALGKLKSNATGVDGINAKTLNMCVPVLIDYVTHIFNFCIENSQFPKTWKSSIIRPLPKTSNVNSIQDLRPISILPTLGKIFERCIESQLREFVNVYDVLPPYQSGFRPGFSSVSAVTHVVDDVLRASDAGNATVLVLLDFSRAFDTIHHKVLLNVLAASGLGDAAIALMESYLSDRSQQVLLDTKCSSSLPVSHGVPQGAILSPLLFSLYTSGLPAIIQHCQYHLYADDTQIYLSFKPENYREAQQCLQHDIERICHFATNYQLQINPGKTQLIVFGSRRAREIVKSNLHIKIASKEIPFVECVKNLGIWLDSSLRFDKNTSKLVQKAFAALKSIFINRHFFDTSTRSLLCESLVLSNFTYGDVLYSPSLKKEACTKIQKVQNCCVRLIYGLSRHQRISHVYRNLHILDMRGRRLLHQITYYIIIIRTSNPTYLYSKIQFRHQAHNVNIRANSYISIPKHRLEQFKNSFTYSIAKHINDLLPIIDIYNFPICVIRSRLRQHILNLR